MSDKDIFFTARRGLRRTLRQGRFRLKKTTELLPPIPLPLSAVEYWHSERQATPASWIGQLKPSLVPSTSAQPAVAPDAGYFNNRPVVKIVGSPAQAYTSVGPKFSLLPGSSRPYAFAVARFLSQPFGINTQIFSFGDGVPAFQLCFKPTTFEPRIIVYTGAGSQTLDALAPAGTQTLVFEAWLDGTNLNLRVNGVLRTAANTSSLALPITAVGMGVNCHSPNESGNIRIAFGVLCSAKPTDPEIAALRAWAASYWGSPP